jgi:hypothetical protein
LTLNCKEKSAGTIGGVFTFLKGKVTVNGVAAKLGNIVKKGDLIASKKGSAAVVQFSDGALITVKSSSEINISDMSKSESGHNVVVTQNRGSTFSKIISSEKVQYSISSPTLTAGIRGTSFELNVDKDGATEVKLLKGKVAVSPSESEEETLLDKGSKLKVTETYGMSTPQKLNKSDVKKLSALDEIQIVPDIEKKVEEKDLNFENVISAKAENVVKEITEERKEYTLEDLKKEYGKISKIITKSGKVYIGNFLQKGSGKTIQVRTVDGQFTVHPNEIKKVFPF